MSVPVAIKTEEVILESAEYNSAEELDEELQLQLEDSGGEYIQYQAETQVPQRQRHSSMNMNSATAKSPSGGGGGGGDTTNSSNINNSGNGKNLLESEKRMRREIANSNERRRMQSINAGFQNLRALLPRHEGDKLSKAAILQQTSQYIYELENQKTQLLNQNSQLKRQLGLQESNSASGTGDNSTTGSGNTGSGDNTGNVAMKKRKLTDNVISLQTISDSSDEGLGSMSPEPTTLLNAGGGANVNTKSQVIIAHNAATTKELNEMKKQLEKERRMRTMLEEELQMIKRQLYSVATAPPASSTSTYIPREVIEHTDNLVRETMDDLPAGTVSYVEIDEMTGQRQVVVCSSIEELESEAAAAAADIITEDNVQEEIILSSTESEQEVNAIAKAYAEGSSPSAAVLQPILQAAIKATPKVEVERIQEIIKVKTEKIDQPSGLTRSRQNLETIVEAIRHLEGDHLFADGSEQKLHQQQQSQRLQQDAPLALTTKVQHASRATLAELRPYLQIKGNKQVTILQQANPTQKDSSTGSTATVMPTAIYKVQTTSAAGAGTVGGATQGAQHVTITTTALKQVRPGVIVAKQLS